MKRMQLVTRWVLGFAILLLAGSVLLRQLQNLSIDQLRAAWFDTPLVAIAASALGTLISFACLASYECFATRKMVPGRVSTPMALGVGAMSHAISNTLGFHPLTGGAVRYRAYRSVRLDAIDVARIVAAVGACVAIGVTAVVAMALFSLQLTPGRFPLVLLLTALAWLLSVSRGCRRWLVRNKLSIALRNAGWLSLVGLMEMMATVGALYVLMPAGTPAFAPFILLFVTAMVLGIISHVPGGLGVFEISILAAMPVDSHTRTLVALLLYRAIYNLLPFALAMMALSFQLVRPGNPRLFWPFSLKADTDA